MDIKLKEVKRLYEFNNDALNSAKREMEAVNKIVDAIDSDNANYELTTVKYRSVAERTIYIASVFEAIANKTLKVLTDEEHKP